MKAKTLVKLAALGEYASIRFSHEKHFFFKLNSIGKMDWSSARKYKPLDFHELNAIRMYLLSLPDDTFQTMWLATDISKIKAKVYNNWSNSVIVKLKSDLYDVHPVYRFNLTKPSQCGIV